jgi:hypothetical protein
MTTLYRASYPFCMAVAIAALAGCATVGLDDPVKDAAVTLTETQSVTLSRTVTLRYDSVNDSRCPRDVMCIWAGKVSYHFTLDSRHAAEPFQLDAGGAAYASAALKGVTIAVAQANPPPPGGVPDAPLRHPVTLAVRAR